MRARELLAALDPDDFEFRSGTMDDIFLTARNFRIFVRDRSAVFFSLLSPLILMGRYALFLGKLQLYSLQRTVTLGFRR